MAVRSTYTILVMNGISNTIMHTIIDIPFQNEKLITFSTTFQIIGFFDIYGIVKVYSDIHNHTIYSECHIHIDNGDRMKRFAD